MLNLLSEDIIFECFCYLNRKSVLTMRLISKSICKTLNLVRFKNYAQQKFGYGCRMTYDPARLTKYLIQKGDEIYFQKKDQPIKLIRKEYSGGSLQYKPIYYCYHGPNIKTPIYIFNPTQYCHIKDTRLYKNLELLSEEGYVFYIGAYKSKKQWRGIKKIIPYLNTKKEDQIELSKNALYKSSNYIYHPQQGFIKASSDWSI